MNTCTETKEYTSIEEAWAALQAVPSYIERGTEIQEQERDALLLARLQEAVAA